MKNTKFNVVKKLLIAILIIMCSFSNFCYAEEETETTSEVGTGTTINSVDDIFNMAQNFRENGKQQLEGTDVENIVFNNLKVVGKVLVSVGVITMLIVTAITAIKWITATPDKQAKLKQQLIGLVVSGVVIFGAVGIWNLMRSIMESLNI